MSILMYLRDLGNHVRGHWYYKAQNDMWSPLELMRKQRKNKQNYSFKSALLLPPLHGMIPYVGASSELSISHVLVSPEIFRFWQGPGVKQDQ
jgi:hypothetical protein